MSDAAVREKFNRLAAEALPAEKVEKVADALWTVDTLPEVCELMPLLTR